MGVLGRGREASCWGWGFSAIEGRGEMLRLRGWSSFFSLMVETIFSRSSGVMCLSRPRLRLLAESCLRIWGREMSRGLEVEEVEEVSNSRASSSTTESGLLERSGTSVVYRPSDVLADWEVVRVVVLASETGSQQKVSLFHNLQLRFSRRRPSSREPAQRENTTWEISVLAVPAALRAREESHLSTC